MNHSRYMPSITLRWVVMAMAWVSLQVSAQADGYVSDESHSSSAPDAVARAASLDEAASEHRVPQIEHAGREETSIAIGHFARAKSLLEAALREFDAGAKVAKPDSIINSQQWRSELIGRAEDLNRILAPQANASRLGVRYDADARLLGAPTKK